MINNFCQKLGLFTSVISLGLGFAAVKPANAATVIYDFGTLNPSTIVGNRGNASSLEFTVDGITLKASGQEGTADVNIRQILNNQNNDNNGGLAVRGINVGNANRNFFGQIDGRGGDFEALLLEFEQNVKIVSATFTRVNSNNNDDFSLSVNGNNPIIGDIPLDIISPNGNDWGTGTFNFNDPLIGNLFAFSVTQNNDDYRLKSVTFATVPEPTAILGLLSLGMLGIVTNKKNKSRD